MVTTYFSKIWNYMNFEILFFKKWRERKKLRMSNLMKVLKLLVKTYANWCATLNSTMLRNKVRNIIDNNVDNDTVTKTTGQLAWAVVWFSKKLSCVGCCRVTVSSIYLFTLRKLQFHSAVIGQFKTSRTNQMFPAECGFPAKVSCAFSGLYYLCFKIRHFMWILS